MANVALKSIVKEFGDTKVVHGLDLEIENGEFIVLLGPSGCAKTTTLRMIAGLEDITSGELLIDGKVVNHLSPKDRRIAMVFQNYALYPHMTVEENIGFGLKMAKVPKKEIAQKVKDTADILDLTSLMNRRPGELSGGQRQRVAMGRAMVREPSVFLFDEPLSNLDAKLRNQMRIEIKALHRRIGNTMVYVTHDQLEAMTLADRVVILRDGRIEQVGKPSDVYHHPANRFVAGFIGTPSMNFLDISVEKQEDQFVLGVGSSRIPCPKRFESFVKEGASYCLGIRPNHVFIAASDADQQAITCSVTLVELLGAEALLQLKTDDGHNFSMLVDSLKCPAEGDTVQIVLNQESINLFDQETGQSLVAG